MNIIAVLVSYIDVNKNIVRCVVLLFVLSSCCCLLVIIRLFVQSMVVYLLIAWFVRFRNCLVSSSLYERNV